MCTNGVLFQMNHLSTPPSQSQASQSVSFARGPGRLEHLDARARSTAARDLKMQVLLVEDNPAQCALMLQLLMPYVGDNVSVVQTQHEAVRWIGERGLDWDLAIVDLFLSKGHGFGVLKAAAQRSPTQKIVLMSDYALSPVRERAMEEGADLFVEKGLELERLMQFCATLRLDHRRRAPRGGSSSADER